MLTHNTWVDGGLANGTLGTVTITIHKSQGLTLELIVIDIGDVEFAAGLTYVVLTRVRNITDLVFIIYKDKKRLTKYEDLEQQS